MPSLALVTNVKLQGEEAKNFARDLAEFGAEMLNKPLGKIVTQYSYNEAMTWGGKQDTAFVLNIISLGNLTPDKNKEYSKKLSEWLPKKVPGLDKKRGYIIFQDPGGSNIGYDGTTE